MESEPGRVRIPNRTRPRSVRVGGRAKLKFCRRCQVFYPRKYGHTHKEVEGATE